MALLNLTWLAAVLFGCGSAHAENAQALLHVSAVVARHADVSIAQPASITVTAADVARGYLDLPVPVRVVVRGNMAEGYCLLFERSGNEVGEVQVLGLGRPLVVGADEAMSERPAPGRGFWREQLSLQFRIALAPQAVPGEHAWPVRISLMPR
ncbi:MAG: hypothetical protein KGL68_13390 [Burkholderiales bacterium]|nr:hypothetical protein [Burkholderiales bacterium]